MAQQYLLTGDTVDVDDRTRTDARADTRSIFDEHAQVQDVAGQKRDYEWNLSEWTKFTMHWLYHNAKVQSPRSQSRYLAVWLDFFGGYNKFEYMPFDTEPEKIMRIMSVLSASPVKPWLMDARSAATFKVYLETRTHTTGKAERKGKKGYILQKDTRRDAPMSASSIANALAVMSSYFKKASQYFIFKDGVEAPLYNRSNPFGGVDRPTFKVMFKRKGITADEIDRVLGVIPTHTARGAMHFALILTYALTGLRNSSVRLIRAGDFTLTDDKVYLTWYGKHHTDGSTLEIHPKVWDAITNYLQMAGRPIETLDKSEYIFTALGSNCKHNAKFNADWQPGRDPLSIGETWRVVKLYCKKAKLKNDYTVHSFRHGLLRHMLKVEKAPIEAVKRQAGHANIATTLIYTEEETEEMDTSITRFAEKIGAGRHLSNHRQSV